MDLISSQYDQQAFHPISAHSSLPPLHLLPIIALASLCLTEDARPAGAGGLLPSLLPGRQDEAGGLEGDSAQGTA